MKKLQDKVVIVTGGAGGIGAGISHAVAKEGAVVAIVDFNAETGNKTLESVQQYSPNSIFIQANLMERENLKSIIDTTVEKLGKLDTLINNAHASAQKLFEDITEDDLALSMGTGFLATHDLMQHAFPHLKETKGSIINFASGAGIMGNTTQSAYAAAKEAIRGLSRTVANEWGQYEINVNVIGPLAMSEGVEAWKEAQPEYYERVVNNVPLRRFGDAEADIGRVAVFLASEDANYITGQTIMVDGGSTMVR